MAPLAAATAAVVADVSFTNNISLGILLVTVILTIGFAWANRKDKRAERWENLYELADSERKETQDDLRKAMVVIAEQKEVIAKLEAMQMPTRVMEVMTESVRQLNEQAEHRQTSIKEAMDQHLILLGMIADRLEKEKETTT